jgi:hypothetical protein
LKVVEQGDQLPHQSGNGDVDAMLSSPRCGAKTRKGAPCQSPAVSGKKRCRMHGGAAGSGAPKGNKNAWKHGDYSATTKAEKRRIQDITRRAMDFLKQL